MDAPSSVGALNQFSSARVWTLDIFHPDLSTARMYIAKYMSHVPVKHSDHTSHESWIKRQRRHSHITPVLRQLHWLPIWQRITFKLAMIVFKCLHGLAPSYLSDVCVPVASVDSRWQLRSAVSGALVRRRTRTNIDQRDFAVSGPAIWNCLPSELRTSSLSMDMFAKKLKTHLFSCC